MNALNMSLGAVGSRGVRALMISLLALTVAGCDPEEEDWLEDNVTGCYTASSSSSCNLGWGDAWWDGGLGMFHVEGTCPGSGQIVELVGMDGCGIGTLNTGGDGVACVTNGAPTVQYCP